MMFSGTLGRYLGRVYIRNFLAMTAVFFGVIYLFDTIEILRRAAKRKSGVPLSAVLEMGLMKLPDTGFLILPFAVLFSAMFTFWALTRRQELVAIRTAGFSAWQFLAPVAGVAMILGVVVVTVLNPFGAVLLDRFSRLEDKYLTSRSNEIALLDEGLWLRQFYEGGYAILHAQKVALPEWRLQGITAFVFRSDDSLIQRVDADSAALEPGRWVFRDGFSTVSGREPQAVPALSMPTDLTPQEIEKRFSSPQTLSFWKLIPFIRTMETTGFDAAPLKVRFQMLLAQPLLYVSMILLAAVVTLRPPRMRGALFAIATGIMAGFLVFFASSFLQALGATHQMPVVLAAWAPAFITLLFSLSILLNQEDG